MAIFFKLFPLFVLLARIMRESSMKIKLKIHVEDNINTKCKQSSGYITQIIKNEIFNSTKRVKITTL